MAEMRLTVTHTGKGHALDCETPDGTRMTFDAGGKHGASPMQHLLAAIGACALMDVEIILTKKRLQFSNLRVECVAQRTEGKDANPLTDVKLVFRLDGSVPQKAFDDAVRLSVEKYCSVNETLKAAPPVRHEAVIG